ncbi:replication protein A 32 kDa subunit B-like [Zingiber officinale]|uniref:replication protein A 32 kDa subunit B-like n=1 Tax=Zingiber officinale TaxID=94328 RepID=UPI001C4C6F96|nr:replication protein A 32 kDa subunit B-like [Zingiber officinale]XP_042402608.1 replication protein A 32 kDa subunit B-like [Zingiber officinale]XP_042406179.1 replication protein A 32 kDa subunit B-like [Zingiber officinale]XP_042406180.1 replication protein A 32 kDa subunit B-like [Zingiber officinale]XP_042406181.1 replication protein A 32 kDa subunit B-like [Zingiber officinale]
MYASQADGGAASLFSGGGFMPSQATQTPDTGFFKSRGGVQAVLPLTVKQISEAYHSNDDKSNFVVDGVEASNVRLLGLVVNKAERVTDVSFSLDDGTGRVDINRWVNETSDSNEMAIIQNGMYVTVSGSLKGFQGKKHVVAFCVRPVTDFNHITLHFLECIHVHLDNIRVKPNVAVGTAAPFRNDAKGYQMPTANQFPTHSGSSGSNNVLKLVLDVFQEPASLAREHGLHVDEIIHRLGLPVAKIKEAIEYHVDIGNIYSTVDENHYKSACNG